MNAKVIYTDPVTLEVISFDAVGSFSYNDPPVEIKGKDKKECECGAAKVKSSIHSPWCPMKVSDISDNKP